MDSHGSRPFVYYTKNCRTKFSKFSLILHYYKKTKGPCVHDCCCSFSNYLHRSCVSPDFVIVVLLFWGSWWQQQHSQVNRLQLSDDPLILLSFFNIIFFSESASLFRQVRSRPASASRSTGSSRKKGGNKANLEETNVERLLNSSNCLERHCFSAKRHFHQRQRSRFPHVRRSSV